MKNDIWGELLAYQKIIREEGQAKAEDYLVNNIHPKLQEAFRYSFDSDSSAPMCRRTLFHEIYSIDACLSRGLAKKEYFIELVKDNWWYEGIEDFMIDYILQWRPY